jgi:hypothetical protein
MLSKLFVLCLYCCCFVSRSSLYLKISSTLCTVCPILHWLNNISSLQNDKPSSLAVSDFDLIFDGHGYSCVPSYIGLPMYSYKMINICPWQRLNDLIFDGHGYFCVPSYIGLPMYSYKMINPWPWQRFWPGIRLHVLQV